jgi:hypothetical protein
MPLPSDNLRVLLCASLTALLRLLAASSWICRTSLSSRISASSGACRIARPDVSKRSASTRQLKRIRVKRSNCWRTSSSLGAGPRNSSPISGKSCAARFSNASASSRACFALLFRKSSRSIMPAWCPAIARPICVALNPIGSLFDPLSARAAQWIA